MAKDAAGGRYASGGRAGDIQLSTLLLPSEATRAELLQSCRRRRADFIILECRKQFGVGGGWRLCRVREDKTKANGVGSAWRAMEVMLDDLQPADLIAALALPQPQPQPQLPPDVSAVTPTPSDITTVCLQMQMTYTVSRHTVDSVCKQLNSHTHPNSRKF